MKVYFISGLAADSRVFKHIKLPDEHEMVPLDWIEPGKNESLQQYAHRLAEKIDASREFALVGLSMGGMMAAEIAKLHKPVITILLSSVPSNTHLPFYFKWAYRFRLHKLVPVALLKSASILKRGLTPDSPEDKEVLKQVIKDSDPRFIKWAMQAILSWNRLVAIGDAMMGRDSQRNLAHQPFSLTPTGSGAVIVHFRIVMGQHTDGGSAGIHGRHVLGECPE